MIFIYNKNISTIIEKHFIYLIYYSRFKIQGFWGFGVLGWSYTRIIKNSQVEIALFSNLSLKTGEPLAP